MLNFIIIVYKIQCHLHILNKISVHLKYCKSVLIIRILQFICNIALANKYYVELHSSINLHTYCFNVFL